MSKARQVTPYIHHPQKNRDPQKRITGDRLYSITSDNEMAGHASPQYIYMPTTTLAAIRALPDCGVDLDQIPDNVPHGGYASIFFGRLRATGS